MHLGRVQCLTGKAGCSTFWKGRDVLDSWRASQVCMVSTRCASSRAQSAACRHCLLAGAILFRDPCIPPKSTAIHQQGLTSKGFVQYS